MNAIVGQCKCGHLLGEDDEQSRTFFSFHTSRLEPARRQMCDGSSTLPVSPRGNLMFVSVPAYPNMMHRVQRKSKITRRKFGPPEGGIGSARAMQTYKGSCGMSLGEGRQRKMSSLLKCGGVGEHDEDLIYRGGGDDRNERCEKLGMKFLLSLKAAAGAVESWLFLLVCSL